MHNGFPDGKFVSTNRLLINAKDRNWLSISPPNQYSLGGVDVTMQCILFIGMVVHSIAIFTVFQAEVIQNLELAVV